MRNFQFPLFYRKSVYTKYLGSPNFFKTKILNIISLCLYTQSQTVNKHKDSMVAEDVRVNLDRVKVWGWKEDIGAERRGEQASAVSWMRQPMK